MEARGGVKCDTCTWENDCTVDEMLTWINVDCPECGKQKILTEEDRKEVEFAKTILSLGNSLEDIMGLPEDSEKAVMSFDSHFVKKVASGENPIDLIDIKKLEEDQG